LAAILMLFLVQAPWSFAAPIVWPIKNLAEENEESCQRQYDKLDIPGSYIKEVEGRGESMAGLIDAFRKHESNQTALMDSFIRLIAQAIDDKSPYTAAHCARVPELAFMLVEKAEASRLPPFRDFAFRSEAEWREFRVGAWLHDCGKIT